MKRKLLSTLLCLCLLFSAVIPGVASAETDPVSSTVSGETESSVQETNEEAINIPITVNFTEAGPFMPPVNVAARRLMRAMASSGVTADNGLELSKTAIANGDGSYTIRMEAYTTGDVITSTKSIPVDIVLVLDQSGSMAYDFDGNSPKTNKERRQYAMKNAVNSFIDKVAEKYANDADHRMSIVTFGYNASTLQGWTYVNPAGKTTLQGIINRLPDTPSGATNVAAGMQQAETLMGSGYKYIGTNTTRQKVVIVFTDGVPTTGTEFDTTVATNAIASAKKLKDGGATIYTVGIFNGAKPDELYGASGFDRNSDGSVGSDWSDFSIWTIGDIKSYDIPAGNRFLNYLSSNVSSATEIGIKAYNQTFFGIGYRGWQITRNFDRTSSGYYLTAASESKLNEIFQTISENIQTANIDLGSQTVVKDTVSKYFDLPTNASDIRLYTAAAKADGTFENAVADPNGVNATISSDGTAVSVTGFDFNANFVSENAKTDGTYGKKLIIEFTVTPKDGFIGGNDVPTNDWEHSAVYDKNGAEVEKFADASTTPTVNVPIKDPNFTVNNKTIYEGNSIAVSELYTLSIADTTGWQYDYVNVTAGAADVVTDTVSPTYCTDYNVKVTYAPKTDGSNSEGTANAMAGKSKALTAKVHVLKPTVTATVNDVQKFYGESYTLGDGVNGQINVEWTDKTAGHTVIPAATGSKPYDKDDLTLDYSFTDTSASSKIVPKHDFDVTVKVKKNGTEIPATITTSCNVTGSSCGASETDGKYTVHVQTCQLTITKTGGTDGEPYVFNIKKNGELYTQATVTGNGSVTIYELPVGTYTIEEDTNWSWRFTSTTSGGVTLSKDNTSGTITCTNTQARNSWLNGFSQIVQNIFGVSSTSSSTEGGNG